MASLSEIHRGVSTIFGASTIFYARKNGEVQVKNRDYVGKNVEV